MADPRALALLVGDLTAEHAAFRSLVADLEPPGWDLPTPAEGWAVRDQVSHLAYFDDAASLAIDDADGFAARARELFDEHAEGDPMRLHLERGRAMRPAELLEWWDAARVRLTSLAATVDPDRRIAWFGPPMGALSFLSARLMETWAHGLDVADALGKSVAPSARLRHIAHLGVRTREFSCRLRGLEVSSDPILVDLVAPDGAEHWRFGEPDAEQTVRGSAYDFCAVVTQRRHVDDTDLVVAGAAARSWLEVAQAYAGPPGSGRSAADTA